MSGLCQFGEADDIVFRGDDRLGVDPYVLTVLNGRVRFVLTNDADVLTTVSATPYMNHLGSFCRRSWTTRPDC